MKRLRRSRRGFTLLESMMAGVIFLLGVTGVTVLAGQIAMLGRRGVLNSQLAQVARDEINKDTITGFTSLNLLPPSQTVKTRMPSGVEIEITTEIFDTGQPPGSELAQQKPECLNLGAVSKCIRVTVADKANNKYISATYVTF